LRWDCCPCIAGEISCCAQEEGEENNTIQEIINSNEEAVHGSFFKSIFSPLVIYLRKPILFLFIACFGVGFVGVHNIQIGLDQRLALPKKSYLVDYFDDLSELVKVGPPVFFVGKSMKTHLMIVRNLNATDIEGQYDLVSKTFKDVKLHSLISVIEANRKLKESFIALPVSSWIDDYLSWLSKGECCEGDFFEPCQKLQNRTLNEALKGELFLKYLPTFLEAPPDSNCPLGGRAAYANAVVPDFNNTTIVASHFRTYHTVLNTQADFIAALEASRTMVDLIKSYNPKMDVFAYSIFYVFFEQYLGIVQLALILLGSALAIIFILTVLFLGNILLSAIVTVMILSILLQIAFVMSIWGITLNAIAIVNLLIAAGKELRIILSRNIRRVLLPHCPGLLYFSWK
jgi:Niemann-Pick C1 protein